jgi:hypothetical protein
MPDWKFFGANCVQVAVAASRIAVVFVLSHFFERSGNQLDLDWDIVTIDETHVVVILASVPIEREFS